MSTLVEQLSFDLDEMIAEVNPGLERAFHMLALVTVADRSARCFCGLVVVAGDHREAQGRLLRHVETSMS